MKQHVTYHSTQYNVARNRYVMIPIVTLNIDVCRTW